MQRLHLTSTSRGYHKTPRIVHQEPNIFPKRKRIALSKEEATEQDNLEYTDEDIEAEDTTEEEMEKEEENTRFLRKRLRPVNYKETDYEDLSM